jgi:hypothetical protein
MGCWKQGLSPHLWLMFFYLTNKLSKFWDSPYTVHLFRLYLLSVCTFLYLIGHCPREVMTLEVAFYVQSWLHPQLLLIRRRNFYGTAVFLTDGFSISWNAFDAVICGNSVMLNNSILSKLYSDTHVVKASQCFPLI